jgi:hypothetical protein
MHLVAPWGRIRPVCVLMMIAALAASTACATRGGVPRPFPGAPAATNPEVPEAGDVVEAGDTVDPLPVPSAPGQRGSLYGRAIAQYAMAFRGVPYRLGGSDPSGFDCSGLVQYVFGQHGLAVPRIVEEQWEIGKKVKPEDIQPGDLLFFNTKGRGDDASHVAIAIGGDSFVHAPNSTGVVRVETLWSSYWGSRYVGARRITTSATSN